jgi:hypothetical protein
MSDVVSIIDFGHPDVCEGGHFVINGKQIAFGTQRTWFTNMSGV